MADDARVPGPTLPASRTSAPIAKLDFHASEAVQAAISTLGRTEDVRFAPGNRLLALAGFGRKRCLLLKITVETTPAGPRVSADDFLELTSDRMGYIHGIDFIDDETLVVANRDGRVAVFRLPSGEPGGRQCHVQPIVEIRGRLLSRVWRPGSVAVRHEPGGLVSVLVCNNYSRRVTRHVIDPGDGYRIVRDQILYWRGLNVPDGIAISPEGEWTAVSSHLSHDVKLFAATAKPGRWAGPDGALQGLSYAHGLRFTADGRFILVADAGRPVVHVYHAGDSWRGERQPVQSVTVLDGEAFARGRTNKEEGGPKGLDIDRTNQVVAITCEEQPLAFYPLGAFTVK